MKKARNAVKGFGIVLVIWGCVAFWLTDGHTQSSGFSLSHQTSPIDISSEQANGSQDTGCAAASFGAAATALGTGHSRDAIIAHFKNVTDIASGMAALRSFLNGIAGRCFEITLMKTGAWQTPPVTTRPNTPTVTTQGNTRTKEFSPYNFDRSEFAHAINEVGTRGGVIAGGVSYNPLPNANGVFGFEAAHMVQITGVNIRPNNLNGPTGPIQGPSELRYNLEIFDPYYGSTRNTEYHVDNRGRSWGLFWGPMPAYYYRGWFHLEDLIFAKEVPCGTPPDSTGPTTPGGGRGQCATPGGTSCTVPENCGPNPAAFSCDNYCCEPLTLNH